MSMLLFADADYSIPINLIIWCICVGVNLGFFYGFYTKNIVGSFVRRLLNINSEENAKTITELGYKKINPWHKMILRNNSLLRKVISVQGGSLPITERKDGLRVTSWESAKFYISESNKQKATNAYGVPQKWIFLPVFVILSVLISVGMCFLMPFFIDALPLL